MYSSAYVWAKVLSHMEERLGAVTVSAWFDDAEVVELNENNLILYSPSDFRREIIRRRCTDYIQDALKEVFNSDAKLMVFEIDDELKAMIENEHKNRDLTVYGDACELPSAAQPRKTASGPSPTAR